MRFAYAGMLVLPHAALSKHPNEEVTTICCSTPLVLCLAYWVLVRVGVECWWRGNASCELLWQGAEGRKSLPEGSEVCETV